ncbi:MAG: hypothetical protein KDM64_04655 [Verrucomicrobiae bacterium]|nr:hypothetical protein [Verrucomicrobiae bacterium]
MARKALLLLGAILCHSQPSAGAAPRTPLQARVEARLTPSAVEIPAAPEKEVAAATETVLQRPDPGTFFSRYIFGLKRHSQALLTPEQAARLEAVIAERSPIGQRWHDERNTLRCRFNEVMWHYAGAPEGEAAAALRTELAGWMDLRMAWTLREHLAAHDFDREVWTLLVADQQRHLLAGDWQRYAKLDTGHARGNATAKVITRALGPPDHPEAFAEALAAWETERLPLHQRLADAEAAARRVGFAMDRNSAAVIRSLTETANAAYAALYLAEADATRRLVRVGYDDPEAKCRQAAKDAWAEAKERFQAGASELISVIESR